MKLYLAVATLLLVLIAHSEAEEPTIEQHFANFHTKVMEFGEGLAEKTTQALAELEKSEIAVKTKSWFSEQFEKVKQKFDDTFNKPE